MFSTHLNDIDKYMVPLKVCYFKPSLNCFYCNAICILNPCYTLLLNICICFNVPIINSLLNYTHFMDYCNTNNCHTMLYTCFDLPIVTVHCHQYPVYLSSVIQ